MIQLLVLFAVYERLPFAELVKLFYFCALLFFNVVTVIFAYILYLCQFIDVIAFIMIVYFSLRMMSKGCVYLHLSYNIMGTSISEYIIHVQTYIENYILILYAVLVLG